MAGLAVALGGRGNQDSLEAAVERIDTTISGKQVGTYMMTRCEDDNQHTIPYDDYDLTELSADQMVASMDQALADRDAEFDDIHHVSFYNDEGKLWAHVSFKDPDVDTWIEELD